MLNNVITRLIDFNLQEILQKIILNTKFFLKRKVNLEFLHSTCYNLSLMTHALKIYIDRLSGERTEKIEETLAPSFIDVDEKDLQFPASVSLKGKAYLAEDHLIIQLKIETEAKITCAICNERVKQKIDVKQFYHTEELENIRGHVYDYTDPLREAILLEVPSYVECLGSCPKRTELKNYFQEETSHEQFPFSDLS